MRAFLAALLLGAAPVMPADASAQEAPVRAQFEKPKAAQKAARQEPPLRIVQDYEPDPAIWLLRDEDTQIYLLGTVHVLPDGFRWRSERLDGIVAKADELVVETTGDDEGADISDLLESLEDRPRVSDRLSPENGPKWRALGKRVGLEADYFDRLPPLLALFGIATVLDLRATGSEVEHGVETVLEAEFRTAGKPIGSIESAAEVLASLLAADDAPLIEELDRDLDRWDGLSLESMLASYAGDDEGDDADTQELSPLWQEHAWARGEEVELGEDAFGDTAFGRIVTEILLENRNRAWAGWLENRLAQPGTVLVAVGAAHLAGDKSVQVMLTERGLAAERLD